MTGSITKNAWEPIIAYDRSVSGSSSESVTFGLSLRIDSADLLEDPVPFRNSPLDFLVEFFAITNNNVCSNVAFEMNKSEMSIRWKTYGEKVCTHMAFLFRRCMQLSLNLARVRAGMDTHRFSFLELFQAPMSSMYLSASSYCSLSRNKCFPI